MSNRKMTGGLAVYHPTNGRMPTMAVPSRPARPPLMSTTTGSSTMASRSQCPPSRGGPRGGKDIIAVGTNQAPTALAGPAAWTFTFDLAEDCRLCKLNIQVFDTATNAVIDSSTQLVTALNHNNDRLISGLQVNGALFDLATQPGTNPVWGRWAVVSDQIQITGFSNYGAAHVISCSISTM